MINEKGEFYAKYEVCDIIYHTPNDELGLVLALQCLNNRFTYLIEALYKHDKPDLQKTFSSFAGHKIVTSFPF